MSTANVVSPRQPDSHLLGRDANKRLPTAAVIRLHGEKPAGREQRTSAVISLLADAAAALGGDPDTARACLSRALALLEAEHPGNSLTTPVAPVMKLRGGLAGWQIKRVTSYIDTQLGSTIKVKDLVALTRLSSSHFSHAFKESFGEAPFVYITRRRMERARQLMLGTAEPLSQIALACGLYDQAHFTRVFRRVVGISPNVWRRQYSAGPTLTPQPQ
jgi:AraC-like DNA-binding protein